MCHDVSSLVIRKLQTRRRRQNRNEMLAASIAFENAFICIDPDSSLVVSILRSKLCKYYTNCNDLVESIKCLQLSSHFTRAVALHSRRHHHRTTANAICGFCRSNARTTLRWQWWWWWFVGCKLKKFNYEKCLQFTWIWIKLFSFFITNFIVHRVIEMTCQEKILIIFDDSFSCKQNCKW